MQGNRDSECKCWSQYSLMYCTFYMLMVRVDSWDNRRVLSLGRRLNSDTWIRGFTVQTLLIAALDGDPLIMLGGGLTTNRATQEFIHQTMNFFFLPWHQREIWALKQNIKAPDVRGYRLHTICTDIVCLSVQFNLQEIWKKIIIIIITSTYSWIPFILDT